VAIAQLPPLPLHSPLGLFSRTRAIHQTDRIFPVLARVQTEFVQDRLLQLAARFLIALINRTEIFPFRLVTHSNPLKMSFELGYILNGATRIIAFWGDQLYVADRSGNEMQIIQKIAIRALAVIAVALVAAPAVVFAQTDEIQVYDGAIAERGVFNLMVHSNFTPIGLKTPAFPGALVPDKSFNGVTEWAYGVTDWFEAGLYLPLYSISKDRGATVNGGKLRLLFTSPHADQRMLFYAVNFEFSYNSKHWDSRRFTSEIRPIIGLHLHPVDIIVNPILDNSYIGGFKSLDFAPAVRVAYNLSPAWAIAVEEYADYGPLRQFYSANDQSHSLWGVFDHSSKWVNIEAGIGFGLTSASDKLTLKLMLSRDLNSPTNR